MLRDCRALAAKKHVAEFANELDRIIEPMRIYFPNAEVRLGKSGLDVTLDLKYRLRPADYSIFRLIVKITLGGQVYIPGLGFCHDSPPAEDLKGFFYSQHGKSIERLFRQRMLETLEED